MSQATAPRRSEWSDSRPQSTGSPRVLFVIPGDGQGSSMIFARRQADSLKAEGVDVKCFFLRSRTSPIALLAEWIRLRKTLRDFDAQVIHAHFGTVTALFTVFAAGTRPLMITYRGTDLNLAPNGGLRAKVGRWLSQIAALRASHVICVSNQLKTRLWRPHKVTVMPSGVDTKLFREIDRTAARTLLRWRQEERIVLFNAGHDPVNKRLDLAEAALTLARTKLPGLRLEVLRGGVSPALMPAMMNAADCLLVTSDSEGSPTIVQEALACSLPVVSVDVGDVPERLEGVSNCCIEERDPEALASALIKLTRTPLRSNGSDKVNEISLEAIAGDLKRIYGELARK